MYCELKSKFKHSRFTFLHVLRTYLCSFGFIDRYTQAINIYEYKTTLVSPIHFINAASIPHRAGRAVSLS